MTDFFKENKFLIFTYIGIFTLVLIPIFMYQKADIHIFINQFHNSFFDFFFKYSTHIGDGFSAIFFGLVLAFFSFRKSLILSISTGFSGIIAQILKRTIFHDVARPVKFFTQINDGAYNLYLIKGVEPASNFSFPSGHATAAFAIFISFALFSKNKFLKLIFLIIAIIVAFSRVYLSWHFLEDIVAGSFIGFFISIMIYLIFNRIDKPFLDKSLISIFK